LINQAGIANNLAVFLPYKTGKWQDVLSATFSAQRKKSLFVARTAHLLEIGLPFVIYGEGKTQLKSGQQPAVSHGRILRGRIGPVSGTWA